MDNLIDKFDKLGLRLRPWNRRDEIFALTITGDTFFMQEGDGNEIHIQASDKDMNQAVLMVRELPREFEVTISKGTKMPKDVFVREQGRYQEVVRRKTIGGTRHMLLGLDERGHPFVTQLPRNAISVKQAHDILKPSSVEGKQVRGKGANYWKRGVKAEQVLRQGEWFFIEADKETQDLLDSRNLVEKNIPIGPAVSGEMARSRAKVRQWSGNPHVADEIQILVANSRRQVFVRGRVKHVEHATLRFTKWMRVERNTEAGRAAGVSWVD